MIRRQRDRSRHALAFTLIEVLVTISVISIVIPVIMQGISIAAGLASITRQRAEVISLAQSKLDELVVTGECRLAASREILAPTTELPVAGGGNRLGRGVHGATPGQRDLGSARHEARSGAQHPHIRSNRGRRPSNDAAPNRFHASGSDAGDDHGGHHRRLAGGEPLRCLSRPQQR